MEETKTIGGAPATQKPTEAAQAAQPSASQQPRPCPQDCAKCPMPQQLFCSVKMLFNLSREQRELKDQMAQMADTNLGDFKAVAAVLLGKNAVQPESRAA